MEAQKLAFTGVEKQAAALASFMLETVKQAV